MKKVSSSVILLSCALACAQPRSAGPLTVEVFSTRTMQMLTATPLKSNDGIRFCPACAQKPVTSPLRFKVDSEGMVTLNGVRHRQIELSGVFHIAGDAGQIVSDGIWKVRSRAGHLQLLLTLDSERYVALALAGEAAPDAPMESLKTLAIVIRSFALENSGRHAAEGFDLCDSTHCQALRYGRTSSAIEQAVLETSGETLWYGGKRAQVFYTQNCGGTTEAAASVWPGLHTPYLVAHADPYCVRHSLAKWQADIPISKILAIFHAEGWSAPLSIHSARVVRQTASGRALLLEFRGGGRRVLVSASSFRFAVDRSLGWNRLRSDWYTIASAGGVVHISGQGYGNGVGLCQAGAREMAAEGRNYREILGFYFPGTKIGVERADDGWRTEAENGWTLDLVGASPVMHAEVSAAWSAAQRSFPVRGSLRPTVRVFPDTELFREASEEPGWVLAITRGTEIFTQPPRVLARSGQASQTLRHEFLHILVEQEASSAAPLWLREGLVEALSQGSGSEDLRSPVDLVAIDTALAHPANYKLSLWAHEQAGALARALAAAYGLQQVRGWLQSGVPDEAIRRIAVTAH
jgi:stage II sporulation protein D